MRARRHTARNAQALAGMATGSDYRRNRYHWIPEEDIWIPEEELHNNRPVKMVAEGLQSLIGRPEVPDAQPCAQTTGAWSGEGSVLGLPCNSGVQDPTQRARQAHRTTCPRTAGTFRRGWGSETGNSEVAPQPGLLYVLR